MLRHLVRMLAARGKAILYSSHILEVVERVCDNVIVLHKGDVVADDSIARLRTLLVAAVRSRACSRSSSFAKIPKQLARDLADLSATERVTWTPPACARRTCC